MNCPFKTKICGVTTVDDALMVVQSGADAIGLNFYRQGKRYVDLQTAQAIVRSIHALHSDVVLVGVFVNASPDAIWEIVERVGLNTIQLHGDESVEIVSELKTIIAEAKAETDILRAIRTAPKHSAAVMDLANVSLEANKWVEAGIDAILVDAASPQDYGGTGKQVDWNGFAQIQVSVPLLLAGGLTPENVAQAVTTAQPFAVDVASGVEDAPGKKNRQKTFDFVANRQISPPVN